nr:hypothetical protein [Tanacetum cinerariifolium]
MGYCFSWLKGVVEEGEGDYPMGFRCYLQEKRGEKGSSFLLSDLGALFGITSNSLLLPLRFFWLPSSSFPMLLFYEHPNKPRFIVDDPNITMEEYIILEEEKSQRHGRTFNWQTATYGKMGYFKDMDDCFTNFEAEYPAIVFDDTLTSDTTLSCEPTGQAPEKVTGVDLFYLMSMDQGTVNVLYLLAQSLFRHDEAWVDPRPERQPDIVASASRAIEDTLAVDEEAQADPAPVQAPQPLPPAPRTMSQRILRLEEEIYHIDNDISFEEEVVHQRLRKTLTHVLELSSCIYLDDRAWGS